MLRRSSSESRSTRWAKRGTAKNIEIETTSSIFVWIMGDFVCSSKGGRFGARIERSFADEFYMG